MGAATIKDEEHADNFNKNNQNHNQNNQSQEDQEVSEAFEDLNKKKAQEAQLRPNRLTAKPPLGPSLSHQATSSSLGFGTLGSTTFPNGPNTPNPNSQFLSTTPNSLVGGQSSIISNSNTNFNSATINRHKMNTPINIPVNVLPIYFNIKETTNAKLFPDKDSEANIIGAIQISLPLLACSRICSSLNKNQLNGHFVLSLYNNDITSIKTNPVISSQNNKNQVQIYYAKLQQEIKKRINLAKAKNEKPKFIMFNLLEYYITYNNDSNNFFLPIRAKAIWDCTNVKTEINLHMKSCTNNIDGLQENLSPLSVIVPLMPGLHEKKIERSSHPEYSEFRTENGRFCWKNVPVSYNNTLNLQAI